MYRGMRYFHSMSRWRTFSGLLLAAFFLRAWIPAGYMPAHQAAGPGMAGLSFCINGLSPQAAKRLVPDSSGPDAPALGALACAFGFSAGQPTLLSAPMALPAPAVFMLHSLARRAAAQGPAVPTGGPPLGSRAPPG